MPALYVTSVFAAFAALMVAALGFHVAIYRYRTRTNFGDEGDKALRARVRAHGNFIEYVPIALIVLGLVEYSGAEKWLVWLLGGILAAARLAHAIGVLYRILPLRAFGATATFVMLALSGVVLLARIW